MTPVELVVDEQAQAEFATASGDLNPFHTDPIAARRTPFGRVAVHGMHLVLAALDAIAPERAPTRIRATFRHPVGVGDVVSVDVSDDGTRVKLTTDVWTAADVAIELADTATAITGREGIPFDVPSVAQPKITTIDELDGRTGSLELLADGLYLGRRFPHLVGRLGLTATVELVTLTRLVGMYVPGRHSLFSSFDVRLAPATRAGSVLQYEVVRTDERFSSVAVDVTGPTLRGRVVAFATAGPVDVDLGATRPDPHEFDGVRALVVGGSRGLGAVAVELLAAGGADVRFTFRAGVDDAHRVEQRSPGATAHRLDVTDLLDGDGHALDSVLAGGWQPTFLAYFATPPIFDGSRDAYSDRLFHRFRSCYVDAFASLVSVVGTDHLRGILWPSSEAAGDPVPGLAEYGDAKRAGEELCRELAARHPDITVHAPRLPRLLTDQSTSFVPVEFGDTAGEILSALRAVAG